MNTLSDQNITLGKIIKHARKKQKIPAAKLSKEVGITQRYLFRIERNENEPSFDVLFKLIRALNISPDLIFYPEKTCKNSEVENLIRMLSACDECAISVLTATAKALLTWRQP